MTRARPVDAALAALATIAVALPLLTLFTPTTWLRPALVVVAAVALSGVALRRLAASPWVVIGGQAVAVTLVLFWLHGRGHLWYGLPGPDAFSAMGNLLREALDVVAQSAAPAPTTRGVVVAIGAVLALTALVVDALAVTLRAPALAGVPLLTAYLAAAGNAGAGLPLQYFLLPAAAWLALVGRQGVASLRRWATAVPRSPGAADREDPGFGFAALGRVLGLGALALAVTLPAVLPHLPTTFIADGLGRADSSRGASGAGTVRLNSTLDLTRSLANPSQEAVLSYSTTARGTPPLRVDVLDTYAGGRWTSSMGGAAPDGSPDLAADSAVRSTTAAVRVEGNRIRPPQLAVPTPVSRLRVDGTEWSVDGNGSVLVSDRVEGYTVEYADLAPQPEDFTVDFSAPAFDPTLRLDTTAEPEVRAALQQAVPDDATPLETARAIQAYLRSPQFSYTLELPPRPSDAGGRVDGLTAFLRTKQGYCVQFASAMVMMARAEGIPARMAIGFLPGSIVGNVYTVRAADAHAWPELFFPRLGWVRFEPTPGSRSGTAPAYSLAPSEVGADGEAATPSEGPTPTPSASQRPDTDTGATSAGDASSGAPGPVRWVSDHLAVSLGAALVLLALLLVPAGAWLRRVRTRRTARDEAERVEADWQELVSRLGDIGITSPTGATPRQVGQHVSSAAYLDDESTRALGRVVATLERARYAAPGAEVPDVRPDTRRVWRAASATRRRSDRVRAALLPGDGFRQWRETREALGRMPRAAWARLRSQSR
ncbi:MAG TPA: transglutaminaseTgpA domain-containing protein [Dermatophilaceae bacterium]|nr:transglutaminaseTgpA domain-containing protein [Dermatophilaceae bacterium]